MPAPMLRSDAAITECGLSSGSLPDQKIYMSWRVSLHADDAGTVRAKESFSPPVWKPSRSEQDCVGRPCRYPATHGGAAAAALQDGEGRDARFPPTSSLGDSGSALSPSLGRGSARLVAAASFSCPSRRCSLRGIPDVRRLGCEIRNPAEFEPSRRGRTHSIGARKRVELVSTPRELRPRAPLGGAFPARKAIPEKRSTEHSRALLFSPPSPRFASGGEMLCPPADDGKSCDALDAASHHDCKVVTNSAHGVRQDSEACACGPRGISPKERE